ncbi:GntR family transcriptional regulator [Streptomyces sp. NPDC046909]|uniref:GntR family transcriptional regulator n=1 Tax=Streptomyces sp. NPDC046909 TaxID=3155617 RepID=UPI0033E4ECE7
MDAQQAGDGGGAEFGRVATALRARMLDGTYPPQTLLPSQRALAEEFEVSRDTVQRVFRELASEGWIKGEQGRGTRVIKTQLIQPAEPRATGPRSGATLGDVIRQAFERSEVTLDVYTLTTESLDAHIRLQAERIHAREIAPERISLRLLLPDLTGPLPYPRAIGNPGDPRPQERLRDISQQHTESLRSVLQALKTEKLVPDVKVETRRVDLIPAFKLYLLNGVEALHGMYNVMTRSIEVPPGEVIKCRDVLGLGATLIHFVRDADPKSPGSVFVDSMEAWFQSAWDLLARPE